MSMFQNIIVKKYIISESNKIKASYELFTSYFHNTAIQENILTSKEEQFQEGFLRELFVKILGYTLNPNPNFNLITEQKNEKDSKKADGAIIVKGEVVGVIELKDHKTIDLKQVENQAFGYKNNNRKALYVVTSNFEKLRFYIENAIDFIEFNLFTLTYEEFAVLWICLAYESIAKDLPKLIKSESVNNETDITNKLYKDYSTFKRALFADLEANNPTYDRLTLFKKSQKLLDRLLFIFFAEDSGLLPANSIKRMVDKWKAVNDDPLNDSQPLYSRLKRYFHLLNVGHKDSNVEVFAYNGGLFKPDEVLDMVKISDEVIYKHVLILSEYNFSSEVDVNILGHIFENSLTEIEEISNAISSKEQLLQTSKRKRDGVFYTPRYITTYIVENTLGKLCADKKAELEIDESEYFADKKRQLITRKRLNDKLKAYRAWLLQLTICDPACGSGAFLNAALDFLMSEHSLVDTMYAKIHNVSMVFPDIENSILEHNLFGVDINEESVEIAKLALWLRTAKPHRKLNSLNDNIKCGNSLISDPEVAGDKAFDWQKEFPHVFAKGGFDVVIGNPPFVLCQPSNTDEKTLNYYKSFTVASYKIDLFHLFFERAITLLHKHGKLGFITPNTYLTNKYIKPLRDFILNHTDINYLVIHDESVFPDANVDVATIILSAKKESENTVICLKASNGVFTEIDSKSQNDWKENAESLFNIKQNFDIDISTCLPLGDMCYTYFGIQAFDRKTSISSKKINENFIEIIDGGDITPYSYSIPTKYFNFITENIKSGGDWNVYMQDRIVVRQIGIIPIVGMSKGKILASNTLYSIYPKSNKYNLLYILCILNSSVIKKYWLSKHSDSKLLFPKIKGYQLKELPIKQISLEAQQPFVDLADRMLTLNSELQARRGRFLKRLTDNMKDIRVTGALERFDEMEFGQFVTELRKQKIALSLTAQDEWEEYFNTYRTDCQLLSIQIRETDQAIDKMVYALYGLTQEEVILMKEI